MNTYLEPQTEKFLHTWLKIVFNYAQKVNISGIDSHIA